MGALPKSESVQDQMKKALKGFEAQLLPLGLTKEQIEIQTLPELEQSLERVNDALLHPESFGIIRLKVTAEAGMIITTTSAEAHYEIGIVPVLLERKKLILDRIRLLKGEQKIENLKDLVQRIPEEDIRAKLTREIEDLKAESARLAQQSKEVEIARAKEQTEAQEKLARLEMEFSERRAKIMQSFLERESVATIVGSVLLVVITFAQLVAMFLKIPTTEIVNNGFLLILGYFFGQAVSKVSSRGSQD